MRLDEYLRRYDSLALEAPMFEVPIARDFILREIGRGKRVLDLGCLGGQFSKLIKEQNNEVYGVEVNAKAAEAAAQNGIRVKTFDLNDGIPFDEGYFDVVNASEVLEYIYDTKFLLEECNRVLKPGGLFIFTVPNLNSFGNRLRVLSGGYLDRLGAFPDDHFGGQIRLFNVDKIHELCRYTGFQVQAIEGVGSERTSLANRALSLLHKISPSWGEILIVKARRLDQ